ncbi:MAG: hypothetical protein WBL53_23540 [Pseudonocardiaceae bacterium]
MGAFVSVFRVPKSGNSEDECEDAAAVRPVSRPGEWVDEPLWAAVSDGASESLLAGDWASLLARAVIELAQDDERILSAPDHFASALLKVSTQWDNWLTEYLAEREARGRPVQWYEQPKLMRGAYATLLVAYFSRNAKNNLTRWYAAAIGDSCLFHVRENELMCAFPMTSASGFNMDPKLVNSRNKDHTLLASHTEMVSGHCEPGDEFFMCSDALACWFLGQTENGVLPWRILKHLSYPCDAHEFSTWVATLRKDGQMRNDDVALVHIDLR